MEIIQGDCLIQMERLIADGVRVDAVITDPPYCSGGFTEGAKRAARGQGLRRETLRRDGAPGGRFGGSLSEGWFINDNMTSGALVWLLRAMAVAAFQLLHDGGSLLCFVDWRMYPVLAPALESSGLRLRNMIVWDKGSTGLGSGFRPRHELIVHLVRGTGRFYATNGSNVIAAKRVPAAKRHHQTEKPIALMRELVRVVTPPDGTVLDPFCGSGSTLCAALQEGRDGIGIETDSEYCRIAAERVKAATDASSCDQREQAPQAPSLRLCRAGGLAAAPFGAEAPVVVGEDASASLLRAKRASASPT